MGLNFPAAPLVGEVYPTPALPGVPQYSWDGEVWNVNPQAVIVNSYSKAESDARYVDVTGDTMSGALQTPMLIMGSTSLTEGFNEWGSTTVVGAVYFDFHSSATGSDYDVRLTYSGGNATAGQGALYMEAAGFTLTGAFTANGVIRSNSYTQAPTHYFADTGIYLTWDGGNVATNGNFYCHQTITAAGNLWLNGGVIYFRGQGGWYFQHDGTNFNIVGGHTIAHNGFTSYADVAASGNMWANSGTYYFRGNGGLHLTHDGTNFWMRGAHFYTSNTIHTAEGFDNQGNYDHNYAMDCSAMARSVGNGGIICIVHNFSGFILVTNHNSGQTLMFVTGGGNAGLVSSSGGLAQVSIAGAPPENGYVLYNGSGATATFGVMSLRTRPGR